MNKNCFKKYCNRHVNPDKYDDNDDYEDDDGTEDYDDNDGHDGYGGNDDYNGNDNDTNDYFFLSYPEDKLNYFL